VNGSKEVADIYCVEFLHASLPLWSRYCLVFTRGDRSTARHC